MTAYIEKLARALNPRAWVEPGPNDGWEWSEGQPEAWRNEARASVRGILTAMQPEPTDAMVRAGHAATALQSDIKVAYTKLWQAMLQAALDET
jgi:hypothetical protein